ncbi:hypothetical protein HOD08_01205 [bacterium]|nr:hypothetical protein [bacterium]
MNTFLSVVPAIITITLAFATRKILLSLCSGIVSAALIVSEFSPMATTKLVLGRLAEKSEILNLLSWSKFVESERLFIFMFLITLGVIITLIRESGGAFAYTSFFKKKLKNQRQAEFSALTLSSFLFIDDYLNTLTTGSVMTALTDLFKVPRVRLAFMINSIAGALALITPISGWAATITMFIYESGVSKVKIPGHIIKADPFFTYIYSIPFSFHALIVIASMWFIAARKINLGIVDAHRKVANETGNLVGGKALATAVETPKTTNHSISDFIVPIGSLVIGVAMSMLFYGGYHLMGGTRFLAAALRNTRSELSLLTGGLIAMTASSLWLIVRQKLSFKKSPLLLFHGLTMMLPSIMVLTLAWSFGSFLNEDLNTGSALAKLLLPALRIELLPVALLLISTLISFSVGSSWATIAIMLPIGLPMIKAFLHISSPVFAAKVPILYATIGAVLSGSLLGNKISPIADIPIMTASSTGAYHMDLLHAQLAYLLPILAGSIVAFTISGFISTSVSYAANIGISLPAGLLTTGLLLTISQALRKIWTQSSK